MKVSYEHTMVDRRGRRLEPMSLEQRKVLRRYYIAQTPWWRRSAVGYLISLPLVALAVIGTVALKASLEHLYFPGSVLTLVVLFMALIWGVGPALLTLLASTFVLDYFFIPPVGQIDLYNWQHALQLAPFVVTGLTIALITAQRERARLQALAAEQEQQAYAQELQETNQKLEEANKTKDRFLSMASHELKTPITTIRGQAQLALRRLGKQRDMSGASELQRSLERINEQTNRLIGIIDELMDISAIRTGKMALHKKQSDLVELCREVIEDQRLLSGRSITLDASATRVLVQADRDRIAQVIVNLVNNAIKYSPEDSPVEVAVAQGEHSATIAVHDHGAGIPPGEQARIFEAFYRASDAQTSSRAGLGLGLAIAKDIVEQHHGRMWFESGEGKGTTFVVELPRR